MTVVCAAGKRDVRKKEGEEKEKREQPLFDGDGTGKGQGQKGDQPVRPVIQPETHY